MPVNRVGQHSIFPLFPFLLLLSLLHNPLCQQVTAVSNPSEPRYLRVPAEYPSIQEAVNAAQAGTDVVLVGAGVYHETVQMTGKPVRVVSQYGPAATVLVGPRDGAAIVFSNGESTQAELSGFTIRDTFYGIYLAGSSPSISSNVVTNCVFAVISSGGNPVIRGNTIVGSRVWDGNDNAEGSGIYLAGSQSATVERNRIEGNAIGISIAAPGRPIIRDNLILRNRGSGIIYWNGTDPQILQNLIVENGGHGIWWSTPEGNRGGSIRGNTIVASGPSAGAGILATGFPSATEVINNILVGNPGLEGAGSGLHVTRHNLIFSPNGPAHSGLPSDPIGRDGNIAANPLFAYPEWSDYRLQANSPAVDAAVPDRIPSLDIEGNVRAVPGLPGGPALPDIGAHEFSPGLPRPPGSLGAIADPASIDLQWRPFDGATNYVISRAAKPLGPYTTIARVTGTNYVDSSVVGGTVYYYVIAGENSFGIGANSAEVSVKAGNHIPVAHDDLLIMEQATSALLLPLTNDSDPDDDPLSLTLLTQPGDLEIHTTPDGFLVRPAFWLVGTNAFEYRISDGRGGSATGQVTLVIEPARRLIAKSAVVDVTADTTANWQLQATNVSAFPIQFTLHEPPLHGIASIDQTTGKLSYRPSHGFRGRDTLSYITSDPQTNSAAALITFVVQGPADEDGDEVPDNWERSLVAHNPLADLDGDGLDNRSEYLAWTNPNDADSVLRMVSVGRDHQGRVVVSWKSVGGVRYRVLSSDGFNEPTTELVLPISEEMDLGRNGLPGTKSFVDSRPPPVGGTRFYRIRLVQ